MRTQDPLRHGRGVSYGRVANTEAPSRDPTLRTTGVALVLVGFGETAFGFLVLTQCTASSNGVCIEHANAGAGFVLGIAGLIVLAAGIIVYLTGRWRAPE